MVTLFIIKTFKAKKGFKAEINIVAKAKVEVDKFSTVNRSTNSNIEGLDINNSAAGLIALIFRNRFRFFTNSIKNCDVVFELLNKIENVDIVLIAAFFTIFKKPE